MEMLDVKNEKKELREKYFSIRKDLLLNKTQLDKKIFNKLLMLEEYKNAQTVLVYVSTTIEVDTISLIENALSQGKKVGVPKCRENSNEMDYYFINSLGELKLGRFNILEPIESVTTKVNTFENSICIVPAMAFDQNKNRLGFGKGFFDRFLSNYTGKSIGLCYDQCVTNNLPIEDFDKKVDKLVTETRIF